MLFVVGITSYLHSLPNLQHNFVINYKNTLVEQPAFSVLFAIKSVTQQIKKFYHIRGKITEC